MKKLILLSLLAACVDTPHVSPDAGPALSDAGPVLPTECSAPGDCSPGYECSAGFATGTDAGTINRICRKECLVDGDCAGTGTGSICQSQHPPGGSKPDTCTNGCDPITAGGCPVGPGEWACHLDYTWGESPGVAFTFCRTGELADTAAGETCSPFSTCPSGFSCWNAGGGLRCLEICTSGPGCTDVPEWQLGGVQYGVRP